MASSKTLRAPRCGACPALVTAPNSLPRIPSPSGRRSNLCATNSLLHIAVARGDFTQTKALLDAGVPVDLLARDGLTPLHWSFVRDDTAMASLLLERGSPVNAQSAEGATPLMNAVQARSLAQTTFLLDHGADPNAADARGFTALHRAAEMGEPTIVRLLLDRGASPHLEAQGHTPRSLAASRNEIAIVELLDHR